MRQDDDEVTRDALRTITSFERSIFGGSIRRNVCNHGSRFYVLQEKYGTVGSTRLIVAQLWLLPAVTFLIVAVVLDVASNAHQVMRQLSYAMFALFLCCVIGMAFRAWTAVHKYQ
jgi:hypothetical protein